MKCHHKFREHSYEWKRFFYVILIGLSGKESSSLKVSVCSLNSNWLLEKSKYKQDLCFVGDVLNYNAESKWVVPCYSDPNRSWSVISEEQGGVVHTKLSSMFLTLIHTLSLNLALINITAASLNSQCSHLISSKASGRVIINSTTSVPIRLLK